MSQTAWIERLLVGLQALELLDGRELNSVENRATADAQHVLLVVAFFCDVLACQAFFLVMHPDEIESGRKRLPGVGKSAELALRKETAAVIIC